MAMAVVEDRITEAPAPKAPRREASLAVASLIGGCVLLFGLWLVFGGLPVFWSDVLPTEKLNDFLSGALLLIAGICLLTAVCFVWYQLDKAFGMPGLRAGSVVEAFLLFIIASIVFSVGNLESMSADGPGPIVVGLLTIVLLAGLVWLSTRQFFRNILIGLEDQGWFSTTPFKGNQGLRVRRATILGVLVIGISGVIMMVSHHWFGSTRAGASDWYWYVPFTNQHLYIPLMFRLTILGPLLIGCFVFWFAWRIVNWPLFADFLIATEAEMNKVSWTTRKRLVQDTIVVLVTVVLLTSFLFFVDIAWAWVLSRPLIHVLQVDLKAEQQKQQEKTQW
jgi:preprotein translocase SecE subunit